MSSSEGSTSSVTEPWSRGSRRDRRAVRGALAGDVGRRRDGPSRSGAAGARRRTAQLPRGDGAAPRDRRGRARATRSVRPEVGMTAYWQLTVEDAARLLGAREIGVAELLDSVLERLEAT